MKARAGLLAVLLFLRCWGLVVNAGPVTFLFGPERRAEHGPWLMRRLGGPVGATPPATCAGTRSAR